MKENKYFKESEFKCKCGCGKGNPCEKLIEILTEIRMHFGKPLVITSGTRCFEHNEKVGGSPKSQHLKDKAADFIIKGVKTKDVYDYVIKTYGERPLGIALKFNKENEYAGFVHIDTRGKKARWTYN